MSPPSGGEEPAATGPPDRQTLRLLEEHLADDPLVASTVFEPSHHEPRSVVVRLDEDRYPPRVSRVRMDVRWFERGDYSFHYVEHRSDGSRWECRWDRHPNEHDPRSHFHRPPDGQSVEPLSMPSHHPLEVYSTVLGALEERVEQTWGDA